MGNIHETQGRIKDIKKATLKCLRYLINQPISTNWVPTKMLSSMPTKMKQEPSDQQYMMNKHWNY